MDDFTDFYGIGQLLHDAGRDAVRRTREFMTKEVEPVINRYWTTEEFPHDLAKGIAALGIARARCRRPAAQCPAAQCPAPTAAWVTTGAMGGTHPSVPDGLVPSRTQSIGVSRDDDGALLSSPAIPVIVALTAPICQYKPPAPDDRGSSTALFAADDPQQAGLCTRARVEPTADPPPGAPPRIRRGSLLSRRPLFPSLLTR
jgi:hypothetical protein